MHQSYTIILEVPHILQIAFTSCHDPGSKLPPSDVRARTLTSPACFFLFEKGENDREIKAGYAGAIHANVPLVM